MRKETYLKVITLLLFTVSPSFGQENTQLRGIVSAPFLEEASIHIINSTQQTGTVNSDSGSYQILVRENDELLFSSIQYKNVTIRITSEMIKTGVLNIELEEDLNVLAEVNISNITLTGNINTDIAQIPIVRDLPVNFSIGDINNMIFESDINDPQKAPLNLALGQRPGLPGGDVLGIIGLLLSPILPDPKPPEIKLDFNKYKNNSDVIAHLRELFDEKFFTVTLAIKKDFIDDFIYFANDNGLGVILVKSKNQLSLIEFLLEQSKTYNKRKLGLD
ncbi:hypothetical protein BC962_2975 [Gillisia mitskevichiae]|uniref:Carboxypeptidase-like protein n=1 Tax=Gillisia mitskevichiae TaxID=270921 RepID=A0A495P411_9FLAO|nr:hypothetical protein [Gillisia mitskevichiae]RKS43419.1 hypothetical protein BC962_2975 [Gillisia mitskevichiae]